MSVGHSCFCGEGVPVSDGSGEEGMLSVQGSVWDEGWNCWWCPRRWRGGSVYNCDFWLFNKTTSKHSDCLVLPRVTTVSYSHSVSPLIWQDDWLTLLLSPFLTRAHRLSVSSIVSVHSPRLRKRQSIVWFIFTGKRFLPEPSVVEDISAQLISPKDTLLPEDTEMPFRSSLRLSIRPAVHSMEPSYQSPPHPDPPKPKPLHQLTNRHTLLSLHVTQSSRTGILCCLCTLPKDTFFACTI